MVEGEASDQTEHQSVCVDRMGLTVHWIIIKRTCLKWIVITVLDLTRGSISRASDCDPMAARWCVFKCYSRGLIWALHQDRTAATFLKWSTMDRSIVIIDHFWSDGYAQIPYKNKVFFPICKHSSLKSSKLICLDTSLLESLNSILSYPHFRIHGALEVEILFE